MVDREGESAMSPRAQALEEYLKLKSNPEWVDTNRGKFVGIDNNGLVVIGPDLDQVLADVKSREGYSPDSTIVTEIGKRRGRIPIRSIRTRV